MPPQGTTVPKSHAYRTRSVSRALLLRLSTIIIRGPWFSIKSLNSPKYQKLIVGYREEIDSKVKHSTKGTRKRKSPRRKTQTKAPVHKAPDHDSDKNKKPKGTRVFPQLAEIERRRRLKYLRENTESAPIPTIPVAVPRPFAMSQDEIELMNFDNTLENNSLILKPAEMECETALSSEDEYFSCDSYVDSSSPSPSPFSMEYSFGSLENTEESFSYNSNTASPPSFWPSSSEEYIKTMENSIDMSLKKPLEENHIGGNPIGEEETHELIEIARWCTMVNAAEECTGYVTPESLHK